MFRGSGSSFVEEGPRRTILRIRKARATEFALWTELFVRELGELGGCTGVARKALFALGLSNERLKRSKDGVKDHAQEIEDCYKHRVK